MHPKVPKGKADAKTWSQPVVTAPAEMAPIQQKLASLESEIRELETVVEHLVQLLETIGTYLEGVEDRLNGTLALGLRHRFTCDCDASGFVALRIKCTKCRREAWWGWFPEQ